MVKNYPHVFLSVIQGWTVSNWMGQLSQSGTLVIIIMQNPNRQFGQGDCPGEIEAIKVYMHGVKLLWQLRKYLLVTLVGIWMVSWHPSCIVVIDDLSQVL